ncbi:MAG: hydrogenase maturation nickel metallochaperone HypA [Deltaproteobacteria bacterium]|nr:hydrogenase maturation nickel metallochaperone HypA [Deltaproteobacteria bacterium]
MHEVSVAQGIMKIVEDEAAKHGMSHVTKVHVRIGQMANVVPDALLFAFEGVTQGTLAQGAELDIETVPAKGRCEACGIEFDIEDLIFFCPRCDGVAAEVVSGKELELTEIEGD